MLREDMTATLTLPSPRGEGEIQKGKDTGFPIKDVGNDNLG